MSVTGPRYLYLHGFASSPASKKGVAFASFFDRRRVRLERLDLRVPALEELRLSSMIKTTRGAIGSERDRAVVIGSSLGGLTAAHAAMRDARVCALVLLAPAFGIGKRWRARIGDDGMRAWRESGWRTLEPDPEGPPRLHYEFMRDLDELEGRGVPDVRVPTLIVHGKSDESVPIESSRSWAANKPHVRLVEVDDGHPLYGSLERVCEEMDCFLFGAR